jgi:hypothetical protein
MEGEPAVTADSAPEAQAAPSEAADPQDVTHGESTERAADTDTVETPESSDDGDDDHDPETEPSEGDTPEEAKSKAQKRRERRQQREQERIDRAVEERIAAKERERQAETDRQQREAEAQKAREERTKRFAAYIGEDGETDRLTAEVNELNRRIRAEIATIDQDSLDKIEADIRSKEARIASIREARGFEGEIRQDIWNGIEGQILSVLRHPEFADQATKARYLNAEGGIAGALDVYREVVREAAKSEAAAEIAEIKKAHATEKASLEAVARDWRIRAGGEEVPDTTSGGSAGVGTEVFTRERLRQMMQTPEGIAEYRRNRKEIERQELAGLIR